MSERDIENVRALRSRLDACRRDFATTALDDAQDEPSKHFADRAMVSFARLGEDLRKYEYALMHCGSRGA